MLGARSAFGNVARATLARCSQGASVRSHVSGAVRMGTRTFFSTPAARDDKAEFEGDKMKYHPDAVADLEGKTPEKIQKLGKEIVSLNMIEVKELMEYLKKELGLEDTPMGMPMGMPMGGMPAGGAAPAGGGGGADAAEAAPAAEEKTSFELKLDSFNAADKLKVIKEVRAITGLGLKESKELVEGAPKTIKDGVNKEEAEKFKAQIEAVGGKVSYS
eukprot:CAMPEP_0196733246 /NCGR_PEP_ID=MMETSP1091-20130531/12391_1 /TAXON_ID=302021 /ORGANISM="Rhodomonas sp., Strain CCMP768" /LENGTH=216 /DNA_ID=CAMNT_0042076607 /DNA_START=35 /DNA_END=685 /DNA_ORIENTATION=-